MQFHRCDWGGQKNLVRLQVTVQNTVPSIFFVLVFDVTMNDTETSKTPKLATNVPLGTAVKPPDYSLLMTQTRNHRRYHASDACLEPEM